ncbi:hypothetical protein ACGFI9_36085 [Micromonospora sp. NPDC048930]|uniref:hypothetical protein n=1 Tax=Micromonospora sp. NPDC048930 TaxID=3364261 RepID=UPI00371E9B79
MMPRLIVRWQAGGAVALVVLVDVGGLFELRIMPASCWIWPQVFSSNVTVTPGWDASKSLIACAYAISIALLGAS